MKNKILLLLMVLGFVGVGSANYWEVYEPIENNFMSDSGSLFHLEYSSFIYNNDNYMMLGKSDGTLQAQKWNGSGWVDNSDMVCGLGDLGSKTRVSVWNYSNNLYLLATPVTIKGFLYNGTCWNENNIGKNGIPHNYIEHDTINYNNRQILIIADEALFNSYDEFYAYEFNGSGWLRNTSLENGLYDVVLSYTQHATVTLFEGNLNSLNMLVEGYYNNEERILGYTWDNVLNTWERNTNIESGYIESTSTTVQTVKFNDDNDYVYLLEVIISPEIVYGFRHSLKNTFNLSGNIQYKDVDNSSNGLENVYIEVRENNSLNTLSDSNGDYLINNILFGSYTIDINKSAAFNTESSSISSLNEDVVENFNIEFSNPYISNPYNEGNFIKGVYSHNFNSLNLWENPNYVWGRYYFDDFINTSNDKYYYKVCVYDGSNIFSCPVEENKNYSFVFQYSDKYNFNLDVYHPDLTGSRNFTSNVLYIQNGKTVNEDVFSVSSMPQNERESYLEVYVFDIIFLMLIMIVIVFLKGSGKK